MFTGTVPSPSIGVNDDIVGESVLVGENIYAKSNYHTIQNFGGRKFWQNSSWQKLAGNILTNAQNFQST